MLGCCAGQEGLKLTKEQEARILAARQELIERLQEVAAERQTILSSVALLVLQRRPVLPPLGKHIQPATPPLRQSWGNGKSFSA